MAGQSESAPRRGAARQQTPPPEPVDNGVYVAKEALYVGGARAFAPGDIVPSDHVNKFGWQDLVREFDNEGEE